MPQGPSNSLDRMNKVANGWKKLRPDKVFAKMTQEEYAQAIAPAFAAKARVAELEVELAAAKSTRDDAVKAATAETDKVVKAVVGDTEEGEDGELYESFGYVRKSERATGLSRKRKAAPVPAGKN